LAAVAAALALVVCSAAAPAVAAGNPVKDREKAQSRANAAAAKWAQATTQLAKVEDELARLEARTAETKGRLANLEGQVKVVAVNTYIHGGGGGAFTFDTDLGRNARRQAMARYVTLGNTQAIDEYRAVKDDLDAGAAATRKRAEQQQAAAASLRKQKASAYAELTRLATAEKAYLAQVAAAEAAAAAKRAGATKAARSAVAAPPQGGRATGVIASGEWICPVQGPRAFSNDYGQPRSGGRRHEGNDILSPRGTPIVASVSGSATAHNSGLGGLSYYLAGDDGNTYFGTHLSAIGATGRVAAGTVVGYVGDSGNARGTPHLHFEIHPGGGGPVNPYPTLSRYC
jgi:murein DD-endopeptidase MepM/ murein hydrolase activator NlpD